MTEKWVYHITDLSNLAAIIGSNALLSDARMQGADTTAIGYSHIKERRLTTYRVPCAVGQPFVGEFVPFYYCPRSVMLYTVNVGATGRPPGCQKSIVHLATDTSTLIKLGHEWSISDGNAGAAHTSFYNSVDAFDQLDWEAIRAHYWSGKPHQKCAEFLVKDFVPWSALRGIGCYDEQAVAEANKIMAAGASEHRPLIAVKRDWYY